MKNKLNYSLEWEEYFQIDRTSPSGLICIKSNGKGITNHAVGSKRYGNKGYPLAWRITFKGKVYQAHRIIWVLTHGNIDPDLVIDHLDGNPFNNQIENLSLKTIAGNTKNKRQSKNNTTGTTGVSLREPRTGYRYYTAYWVELDGSRKNKSFSIDYLGEDEAEEQAIAYRKEQIQRLILEGANYTERHGY